MNEKIRLYGFNNLTKSLSFNIYDVCYAKTTREKEEYVDYIDEQYNSDRLTDILYNVTEMIGATVLMVSKQDYEPQGASAALLIAEEPIYRGKQADTVLAHLDKSHVTVHTYPESHPDNDIATFRVDIDISTCGQISPLSTLDYLIGSFDSDIITMDYRVRGFTRDVGGKKIFMDQPFHSIQEYINKDTLKLYDAVDMNWYQSNIFHTKMRIRDIVLDNYIFKPEGRILSEEEKNKITKGLRREMVEIFSGENIF